LYIARGHQTAIRYHQGMSEAELSGNDAQFFEAAFAEQDARADLEFERAHGYTDWNVTKNCQKNWPRK
jgi:hypothetical protein